MSNSDSFCKQVLTTTPRVSVQTPAIGHEGSEALVQVVLNLNLLSPATSETIATSARNPDVPDTLRPFSTTNRSSMIDNRIPQRMDAKGWKEKGNELFKAGKFNDAISAYGTGLSSCSDLHSLAELLRNRSAAYLKTSSYQSARQDAQRAVTLDPSNHKAHYRLATSLIHLRSYNAALETLQKIEKPSREITDLLNRAVGLTLENRSGRYDFYKLRDEAIRSPRLCHADYCCDLIELRESVFGGEGGRGVFAKVDIPQGTLIMASKATASVFSDEVQSNDNEILHSHLLDKLYSMVTQHRCGRAVLNLEGGDNKPPVNIDLRRDDIYENENTEIEVTREAIAEIISHNAFSLMDPNSPSPRIIGSAIVCMPSYLNHSCMPNARCSIFGDMIFVRSGEMISAGDELFIHYTLVMAAETLQDRKTSLHYLGYRFICECGLCQFEKENADIMAPAINIVHKVMARSGTPGSMWTVQQCEELVTELRATRLRLYQLFSHEPLEDPIAHPQPFPVTTPRLFALARLQCNILERLGALLWAIDSRYEASFFLAENFAFAKGNLLLSMGTIFDAPDPAIKVYKYLSQSNTEERKSLALRWLEQAHIIWSLVSGDNKTKSMERISALF
jgi:hypothetical protein